MAISLSVHTGLETSWQSPGNYPSLEGEKIFEFPECFFKHSYSGEAQHGHEGKRTCIWRAFAENLPCKWPAIAAAWRYVFLAQPDQFNLKTTSNRSPTTQWMHIFPQNGEHEDLCRHLHTCQSFVTSTLLLHTPQTVGFKVVEQLSVPENNKGAMQLFAWTKN